MTNASFLQLADAYGSIAQGVAIAETSSQKISEIVRALNQSDVKEALSNTGVVVVANSPEEFGKFMKAEVVKWGKVIKDAKIKAE